VHETKKKNVFGVKRDSSRKSRSSSSNQKDSEQIKGRKPTISVSKLLVSSNNKKIKTQDPKANEESVISDDSFERPHNLQ
jgi:HSP90 family molecular chaperone